MQYGCLPFRDTNPVGLYCVFVLDIYPRTWCEQLKQVVLGADVHCVLCNVYPCTGPQPRVDTDCVLRIAYAYCVHVSGWYQGFGGARALRIAYAYCILEAVRRLWAGLRIAYCVCVLRIGGFQEALGCAAYCVLRMRIAYRWLWGGLRIAYCVCVLRIGALGWVVYCVLCMRIAY